MTKPHGVYLVDQKKPNPVATKNNTKKKTVKKSKSLDATHFPEPKPVLGAANAELNTSNVLPTNINLSANKLAKFLGRFMDLRSTIRGMSNSVKQVEEWLDNAYDMFEIAQSVTKKKKDTTLKVKQQDDADDDIPVINLPKEAQTGVASTSTLGSAASLLKNLDIGKVMKVVQSPLFTKAVSYLANRKKK